MLQKDRLYAQQQDAIARAGKEARALFESGDLLCAEAVVMVLNNRFDAGLSENQVIALSAPFGMALGDSGCICGALSGAAMIAGLILGGDKPYGKRRNMRRNARRLHDEFKEAYGATCCRALSRKVKKDKKAHLKQCADLTATAAEMAARLVLQKRPDLLRRPGGGSSPNRQFPAAGNRRWLKRLLPI